VVKPTQNRHSSAPAGNSAPRNAPRAEAAAEGMSTMKQIYVAIEHGGKSLPVGVLRFDSAQRYGFFTYLANYAGPPLDPVNLDYRKPVNPKDRFRRGERVFVVDAVANPGLMHQVFVDAMPGHWGIQVLQAEYPEIRQMKDAERLHWMGARTSGALSFFIQRREDETPVKGLDELEVVRAKCAEFMKKLEAMGLEGARNPAVASHGGAMPKASYVDGLGRHWIAKFDRASDVIQGTVLEHVSSEMARRAGILTPNTKTIADGAGGHMFLSERYDRTNDERWHKISFLSLTGAKDQGAGDYRDMFRALKEVVGEAAWPQQRDELLRRMALNIGLNVTDDHLRNHELRLMSTGNWELSPAFDLVPFADTSPHQCGIFGHARVNINLAERDTKILWSAIASELEVTSEHVFELVGGVANAIKAEWPALVESQGLNKFNQEKALQAAEIGCKTSFQRSAQVKVPLNEKVQAELSSAGKALEGALHILSGKSFPKGADLHVSRALMTLNAEAPRLAHLLRSAGHQAASELLMSAPLKTAARTVLEKGATPDQSTIRDIGDVVASLSAVTQKAATKTPDRRGGAAPR
jgi:hypothetical protein